MKYEAELKLAIVYTYYMFVYWFALCLNGVYAAERTLLEEAIKRYFFCEAVGYVPGRCSREMFEQYSHSLMHMAVYSVLGFFAPIVNLVFLINCRSIREGVRRLKNIQRLRSSSSRPSQS